IGIKSQEPLTSVQTFLVLLLDQLVSSSPLAMLEHLPRGSSSVAMPFPLLLSLRGVGKYSEDVVLNKLLVNYSTVMLTVVGCLKCDGIIKFKGVGDRIGFS
ncbi:hypothetical protein Tco_1279282, partial [Tanacetum coccineum]